MTEEWRLDGDCDNCRRRQYCKKTCKAHKERFVRRVKNMMYWNNVILGKEKQDGEGEQGADD